MENQKIYELAVGWEQLANGIFRERIIKLKETEKLIKETYRICTTYHHNEMVPKEIVRLFRKMQYFVDYVLSVYDIDELSTSSDSAVYDAIVFIIEEIEDGFYNGKYEQEFPCLEVGDSNGNTHVLNMDSDFLELLIEANR